MSVPDIVFIALLGLFALRGFLKGFSGELLSIASFALALIAAFFLFTSVGSFIRSHYLQMVLLPEILGFLAVFLVVSIAGKILQKIIKDIVERIGLKGLDKALGLILGFAEGFALIVLVLFLVKIQPFFDASGLLGNSLFARILLPIMGDFRV